MFFILTFANCSSTQKGVLEPPPNLSRTIETIQEDERLPFPVKQELVNALKESQSYASNCYANFQDSQKKLREKTEYIENLELQIATLEKNHEIELQNLEKELSTWRKMKFWFWAIIISLAIGFLIKLFWPLIRKAIGIPI